MKKSLYLPRIVLVTRKTPLALLLEQHGTFAQARFYLQSRNQEISGYKAAHKRFEAALARVLDAIPPQQRRVHLDRSELDRFLFAPDDVILIVGQDGLVPNAAKYLRGQLAIGINPDADRYDGILCPHSPGDIVELLDWVGQREGKDYQIEHRIMAVAEREDGQQLFALNEVFVGHRSHQSARYRIKADTRQERQSSSGVICATGTGSTGWARSIVEQRKLDVSMPAPQETRLAWFVREPFPSVYTGAELNFGFLESGSQLVIHSEMGTGGVIFADGIEADNVEFLDGHTVSISVAHDALNLLIPSSEK